MDPVRFHIGAYTFRPKDWIRLSCDGGDGYASCSEGYDGITEEELALLATQGWKGVEQIQTWEDAIETYDNPEDAPLGWSVLDWETHRGTCPDCVKIVQR